MSRKKIVSVTENAMNGLKQQIFVVGVGKEAEIVYI